MVSDRLNAHLASGATTLARCWKITRVDGKVFGFTDHDNDLRFDGLTYLASTGMDAQALEMSTGLSVDNSQAVGALSAIGLTESDIMAGRYDAAEICLWWANWQNVEERMQLFRGTLGEVRQRGQVFEVELRGLAETLNRPIGRAYLKTCDLSLGSAKCGVDLSDPLFAVSLSALEAMDGTLMRVGTLASFQEGWFGHGRILWLTGANAGIEGLIKQDLGSGTARRIEVWQEPPFEVKPGDGFTLIAGCDKRAQTCRKKFNNFLNFRGFPHMPGDDWVTAYPRQDEVHDGSVRRWTDNDL
ncbi:DUF2163 domain-containing protein [Algicella marina]|uniref:DUF2163 domain-containing protein n=1 Tax=Algicella marina TaxID=2683284 RepID=A0A6P1T9G7_9RHOB|nr:DUF2163 domain-containing protein [Algicella marina]QHQ37292.1 DUF2163 domain-containing protein [Algicella marina]